MKIARILNKLINNNQGQIAVIAALAAVPIVLGVGYAIDHNRVVNKEGNVRAAIDTAALASVIPAHYTDDERADFAQEVFDRNYDGNLDVTLDIKATRERVDIAASGQVPTLFSSMVGIGEIEMGEKTAAILTRSQVICVLALDESSPDAIQFLDEARFNSPNCTVQSNSIHSSSLVSKVVEPPIAKSFCTAGESLGKFFPYVKHACTPVEDPYADLKIPDAAESCDQARNVHVRGNNARMGNTALLESQLTKDADGKSVIPNGSTLYPGIYCDGLRVEGANVVLQPGVYHVWGDLEFSKFATVIGDEVTFILKGTDNRLLIEEGAQVSLKAPKTGLTAGLVFWQKYLEFWPYVFGRVPDSPGRVIATSEINSGGGLRIVGTAYLPDHELIIRSENSVASQSPATSFIARRLTFAGKTNMQVNVDHVAGDIPPILPRSDDGARLVQ